MDAGEPGGIRLFGRITASVAHDVRNVLAIINENAGLLEDVCLLAEKGRPLDLKRALRIAADLKQQVRRGDRISRGLSHLSHSVDAGGIAMDASEWVAAFVALADRLTFAQGVSLHADEGRPLVQSGFELLQLMWACSRSGDHTGGTAQADRPLVRRNARIGLFSVRRLGRAAPDR